MTGNKILTFGLFVLALNGSIITGCSKGEDIDLIAYLEELSRIEKYPRQLEEYDKMLKETPDSIATLEPMYKFIDEYETAVKSIVSPQTNRVRAINGLYERCFKEAKRQLTNATKPDQYSILRTGDAFSKIRDVVVEKVHPNIRGMLEEFNLQDKYSVEWPKIEKEVIADIQEEL